MLEIILIINIVVLLHNTQDINIIIVILLHQSIMREESLWKASLRVTNWIIYLIEIVEPGQKSPRHKFWEPSCKWSDGLNQSTMFVVCWNYNIVHKNATIWGSIFKGEDVVVTFGVYNKQHPNFHVLVLLFSSEFTVWY